MTISLKEYGPLLSDKKVGEEIHKKIKSQLEKSDVINIDFADITSMATFCAKQIFGRLYIELGPEQFFERIKFLKTNEDIKIIIKMGIQNAIEESK